MGDVKVISVNPGKKTLGAVNYEFIARVARTCRPVGNALRTPRFKTVCNVVFGINKSVTSPWSSKLFIIRTIAAAIIMISGFSLTTDSFPAMSNLLPLLGIIAGGMIFLGMLARVVSIAGFAFYGTLAFLTASGLQWSLPDIAADGIFLIALFNMFIFCVLAITGPGRYSIDQILRRAIFMSAKKRARKRAFKRNRRCAENRLSYKAWRNA